MGVVQLPAKESKSFGVLTATEWNRVTRFAEKPRYPTRCPVVRTPFSPQWASTFQHEPAREAADRQCAGPEHGPRFRQKHHSQAIGTRQVFAYPSRDVKTRAQSYWRDVGTVDAYYDANIELVHVKPELNIYDREWPIWTYQEHQPPAKFILDDDSRRGMALNSMVARGVIISGSQVRNSLVFSDVRIDERSFVDGAVILPHVDVGRGCTINRAIIDEGCQIPDGMSIGTDWRWTPSASMSRRTAWYWSRRRCCDA